MKSGMGRTIFTGGGFIQDPKEVALSSLREQRMVVVYQRLQMGLNRLNVAIEKLKESVDGFKEAWKRLKR